MKTVLSVEQSEQRYAAAHLEHQKAHAAHEHAAGEYAKLQASAGAARHRVGVLMALLTKSVLHFSGQYSAFADRDPLGDFGRDEYRHLWGEQPDVIRMNLVAAERALTDAEHAEGLGRELVNRLADDVDAADKELEVARLALRNAVRKQANLKPIEQAERPRGTADELLDLIRQIGALGGTIQMFA